jgi:hypothetical protein
MLPQRPLGSQVTLGAPNTASKPALQLPWHAAPIGLPAVQLGKEPLGRNGGGARQAASNTTQQNTVITIGCTNFAVQAARRTANERSGSFNLGQRSCQFIQPPTAQLACGPQRHLKSQIMTPEVR